MAATRPAETEPDERSSHLQDLVVITGFSGAGKSTAMNVFEDAGYFCVDNLPPEMIRGLVELLAHEGSKVERAAVVSDVRGGELFEALVDVLEALADSGIAHRVLFLDAAEDTLLTRYKETRRRHPLSPEGTVSRGIAAARALLEPLRGTADVVIDTSGLKPIMLRRRIAEELLPRQSTGHLAVTFESFGFKHGPDRDADLVFDVRFLPNPHYVPELRLLTGHDQRVVDYVGREGKLEEFYRRLVPLLEFVLPEYVREGKAHLTVAIGCTGGRHRSVAIAEHLAGIFRDRESLIVDVAHRDVDKAPKAP
jgi:RNase adapter protein RapZ